jgi:hypothetical protein
MTWLPITLLVLLAAALLAGMWFGWQHRGRRTAATVPAPVPAPAEGVEPGEAVCAPVEATYVSTTTAGAPLERVVAHGLGARSAAVVHVRTGGVVVRRAGAPDLHVPAGDLLAARTAAGMVGKHVGGDGLVVLRWHAPGSPETQLETGLRTRRRADREPLVQALRSVAAGAPAVDGAATPTSEETP